MFTRHDNVNDDTVSTKYWMKHLSDAFETVRSGQQANYRLLKKLEESYFAGLFGLQKRVVTGI